VEDIDSVAWYVYFYNGFVGYYDVYFYDVAYGLRVRCVRHW